MLIPITITMAAFIKRSDGYMMAKLLQILRQ